MIWNYRLGDPTKSPTFSRILEILFESNQNYVNESLRYLSDSCIDLATSKIPIKKTFTFPLSSFYFQEVGSKSEQDDRT